MSFKRQPADKWRRDIPGARWFKVDLHIHTIDDRAGGRAKMPDGVPGDPSAPSTLSLYAKRFLQGVVASGVQVVGLTPHSPRIGDSPDTSAIWTIVDEWNSGVDDDNVPFREKIFAVFPGFEPSFKDGREGLHLIFLFDPEIGREDYLRLFDVLMGGIAVWKDKTLQMSNKSASDAFEELRQFRSRQRPTWKHIVLAPHIDASKGLLGGQKAQILQVFSHDEIAGLELLSVR